MTATTASQPKTTVIEENRARWDTRRFNVFVGSEYRGFVLRNKADAVWVAYHVDHLTNNLWKDMIGQSRSRDECVRMIVGK